MSIDLASFVWGMVATLGVVFLLIFIYHLFR